MAKKKIKMDLFEHIEELRKIISNMYCPFCGNKATTFTPGKTKKARVFFSIECDHVYLDCNKCGNDCEIHSLSSAPDDF